MEEIIIDNVNVAECEHYCEKLNTDSGIIQTPSKQGFCLHNITGLQNADIYFRVLSFPKCRGQSNCYYKQLKRLEQENAELKKRQITKNGFICDCEQNVKYKQALEEIRGISDNYNLTVNKRRKQIANKINEVLGNE